MTSGYQRAFVHCVCLAIAGAVLQFITGGFDTGFLRHPLGLILCVNYLYLLILAYAKSDSWSWVRRLYDRYAMTASLAAMVLLCVIYGTTTMKISTSWPFCLIFLYFTTVMGLRTIDDLHHWKQRRVLPMLIHAAVFIIMAAGIFSSGDKTRIRIISTTGLPVHTGITASSKEVHLPFTVTLKKFHMQEYPPRLYMIDPKEGTSSAEYLSLEEGAGTLEGWDISVVEYLEAAGRLKDSTSYFALDHVGATDAAYIRAINHKEGRSVEGWVSCGSHIFPPQMLPLGADQAIAMPKREPEHYLSEVVITDEDGDHIYNIEVNSPAKIGPWRIYQVSYDTQRGRWSTTSVLECVKDGWYPLIQTALWLILASAVAMALSAGGKKLKKKEVRP